MSLFSLIFKNLFRQRMRSGLTIVGIGIGITTVVALGVIANSLKAMSGEIITAGGADFFVAQKGSADLSFSIVSAEDRDALAAAPGVERADGVLFHVSKVGNNPFFFLRGMRPEDVAANPPDIREGAVMTPSATGEVMLGTRAASDLNLRVGDMLTVDTRRLRVTAIYHDDAYFFDGGGIAPLSVVQEIAGKPDSLTVVYIFAKDGVDPAALAQRLEEQFTRLTSVSNVSEYGKVDQGVELIDAANLAISVLAVGIGAIGVMNTMVMSVFERTREIGILRAVGWSSRTILRMIIGEALLLCLVAAIVGASLGALATEAVTQLPAVGTLLRPQYTADVFVRGFAIAIVVALAGAAYPAYRAVRLVPMEALRHE